MDSVQVSNSSSIRGRGSGSKRTAAAAPAAASLARRSRRQPAQRTACAAHAALQPLLSKLVIDFPLLRVGQHLGDGGSASGTWLAAGRQRGRQARRLQVQPHGCHGSSAGATATTAAGAAVAAAAFTCDPQHPRAAARSGPSPAHPCMRPHLKCLRNLLELLLSRLLVVRVLVRVVLQYLMMTGGCRVGRTAGAGAGRGARAPGSRTPPNADRHPQLCAPASLASCTLQHGMGSTAQGRGCGCWTAERRYRRRRQRQHPLAPPCTCSPFFSVFSSDVPLGTPRIW